MNKLEHPCAETGAAVSAWRDIESAPRDGDTEVLVSISGRVWFQAIWDDDDGWVTFNRFVERESPGRVLEWRYWSPLPVSPPPPSLHDGLRESSSVAGAESEPCGLRTETPAVAGEGA